MPNFAISSGHGKYIRGASGNPVPPQLDEVNEARRVVERVAEILNSAGVKTVTFHDNTSHDQSTNLETITNWHNKQSRDYDVSCHFNAYDGSAHGTEVLYVTQQELASKVSAAISAAGGFTNRGAKKRTDLYVLNNTNKPAVLLETCFCDNTSDSNKYNSKFEAICKAIAESLSGQKVPDVPGEQPPAEKPPEPGRPETDNPFDVPISERPVIGKGDEGMHVEDLQEMLPRFEGAIDGDFGSATESAVMEYQRSRGLDADGIVGQQTWSALYAHKPPLPPPPPPPHAISIRDQEAIMEIANESDIADYSWRDRGEAPLGYTQGMALAFAQTYVKLKLGHPAAVEMAKARTSSDKDALNIYKEVYDDLNMSNERDGPDTLRHLYALLLGHGMRESSGRHCEGRDLSADNVTSDTAEAGLFQTSYNARSATSPEFDDLMDEYSDPANKATCYLEAFDDEVSCTSDEWGCYGGGDGYEFQKLCKECPAFAVESCGLTLRNLANHYGPIIRGETELRREADEMFKAVQDYIDEGAAVA